MTLLPPNFFRALIKKEPQAMKFLKEQYFATVTKELGDNFYLISQKQISIVFDWAAQDLIQSLQLEDQKEEEKLIYFLTQKCKNYADLLKRIRRKELCTFVALKKQFFPPIITNLEKATLDSFSEKQLGCIFRWQLEKLTHQLDSIERPLEEHPQKYFQNHFVEDAHLLQSLKRKYYLKVKQLVKERLEESNREGEANRFLESEFSLFFDRKLYEVVRSKFKKETRSLEALEDYLQSEILSLFNDPRKDRKILLAQRGEEEWMELRAELVGKVCATLRKISPKTKNLEDYFQNAFIVLYQRLTHCDKWFDPPGTFFTYTCATAKYQLFDDLRIKGRHETDSVEKQSENDVMLIEKIPSATLPEEHLNYELLTRLSLIYMQLRLDGVIHTYVKGNYEEQVLAKALFNYYLNNRVTWDELANRYDFPNGNSLKQRVNTYKQHVYQQRDECISGLFEYVLFSFREEEHNCIILFVHNYSNVVALQNFTQSIRTLVAQRIYLLGNSKFVDSVLNDKEKKRFSVSTRTNETYPIFDLQQQNVRVLPSKKMAIQLAIEQAETNSVILISGTKDEFDALNEINLN